MYTYIYTYNIHTYLPTYLHTYIHTQTDIHTYMITTPLRLLFRGRTIPQCKIHFLGSPLNVKLVAERSPGVVFVGGFSKYLQNVCLHFQAPPQKHLEQCILHLGMVPPAKRVVII